MYKVCSRFNSIARFTREQLIFFHKFTSTKHYSLYFLRKSIVIQSYINVHVKTNRYFKFQYGSNRNSISLFDKYEVYLHVIYCNYSLKKPSLEILLSPFCRMWLPYKTFFSMKSFRQQ